MAYTTKAAEFNVIFNLQEETMSKGQDSKKMEKKQPTKTPKERKEEKRLKKEASKHAA